jgi:hypothetical protein
MTWSYEPRDRQNPNTWDTLYADQCIPVDPVAKAYMLRDLQNWSRNYLLIPIRIFANVMLALIMTTKRLLPFQFSAYGFMHRMAAVFLATFVTPEANYLIVRHLCLGSNIVNFLIDNGPDSTIAKSTLYPKTVADLAENAFLEHDLILYNFVLDYHEAKERNPNWLQKIHQRGFNFDSIQPVELQIDVSKRRWFQVLDLECAVELFKIIYSLCLTSDEFERAVISLQFDENFALYFTHLTGDASWNHVVTNRHILAPNSAFAAARNLLLHGLISEYLHRKIELQKEVAQSNSLQPDHPKLHSSPTSPIGHSANI